MPNCEFIDPSTNYECGKKFNVEMIHFINPSQKNPSVYYVCSLHAKIRFDTFNRADEELKKQYDRNEINWQQKRDMQSEIWFKCRKCNKAFEKTAVIWVVIYFRFNTDIQLQVKKAFRLHRECCLGELFLYGVGRETKKDEKLDSFS